MKTNIHFWSYCAHLFLEWKMFQTKVVEKIKTHIAYLVTFFFLSKIVPLWDNVKKCGKVGEGTDGVCSLHSGYLRLQTHSLGICSTYCFCTATTVARTRLNVTFILNVTYRVWLLCIMRARRSDLVQSMKHIVKSVSPFLVIVIIFSSIHFPPRFVAEHTQYRPYTGCFTTLGHDCRRWFPRSLWWKKFI